jgi:DNA-binding NarL/FixJ family response regulator
MGRKIKLAVIDTAGLMREALCRLLNETQELEVIAAIDTTAEEITRAQADPPDVVVMDFCMTTPEGLEAVAAVKRRWLRTHLLMLTSRNESRVVHAALHAGIEGYVLKTDSSAELVSAILTVAAGNRYLAGSVCSTVNGALENSQTSGGPAVLSDREREVMRLIAGGYRTREMALQLSLSHKTIEKHRSNLMKKLGLRSATAVAAYAVKHGYETAAT